MMICFIHFQQNHNLNPFSGTENEWEMTEDWTLYEKPENHNITYNLWTLGNTKVLIRCSIPGCLGKKDKVVGHVVLCNAKSWQTGFCKYCEYTQQL